MENANMKWIYILMNVENDGKFKPMKRARCGFVYYMIE